MFDKSGRRDCVLVSQIHKQTTIRSEVKLRIWLKYYMREGDQ